MIHFDYGMIADGTLSINYDGIDLNITLDHDIVEVEEGETGKTVFSSVDVDKIEENILYFIVMERSNSKFIAKRFVDLIKEEGLI